MKKWILFGLAATVALLFAASPPPREWINSYTTNQPPNTVVVSNQHGGAFTNIGDNVGHVGRWNLYGNTSNTVARLGDVQAQQFWTNFDEAIYLLPALPGYVAFDTNAYRGLFIGDDGAADVWGWPYDGLAFTGLYDVASNHLYTETVIGLVTSTNDLAAFLDFAYYALPNIDGDLEPLSQFTLKSIRGTTSKMDVSATLSNVSLTLSGALGNTAVLEANFPIMFDLTGNGTTVFRVTQDGLTKSINQTNSGTLDVADTLTTYGGINELGGLTESAVASFNAGVKFPQMTPARIASYQNIGGGTYLTNLAYGSIVSGSGVTLSTNLGVLTIGANGTNDTSKIAIISGGGTNNTFTNLTVRSGASNDVALLVNTPAGQSNDVFRVQTNGTTVFEVKSSGNVGIGTNTPTDALDVVGAIQATSGITGSVLRATVGGVAVAAGQNFEDVSRGSFRFSGIGTLTLNANNLVTSGTLSVSGGITNLSTVKMPTNNASINTIASSGLHVATLGKGWTNDLGGRADLIISVKYTDAATGDPKFAFTNTTTGVAFTNSFAFGIVGTLQELVTIPDLSPSDTGSFTDLSGSGATVTFLNSWWMIK